MDWNDIAASGLMRLGHAALWGGLGIGLVGLLCRLLPRIPAPIRAGLWWLACAKLLLDLCWTAPFALPVLPSAAAPSAPVASRLVFRPSLPARMSTPAAAFSPQPVPKIVAAAPAPALPRISWQMLLGLAWLVGISIGLLRLLGQGLNLRGHVHAARPLPPPKSLNSLAAALGLRRVPELRESRSLAAPCIVGGLHPTILLPRGFEKTVGADEMRLALAHELAHARRGDLRMAWLPALVSVIFFFHPLAWWAAAEWAAAREEACDLLALGVTGASPARYGALLLRLASAPASAPALGLSSGFAGLHRRLRRLAYPAGSQGRAGWLLALLLPLLMPWRLTAATTRLPSTSVLPPNIAATRYEITDLGASADDSDGLTLNSSGLVAGTAHPTNTAAQGFLWEEGRTAALGALPRHRYSHAYGLSGQGLVAAASYNIPGRGRAFLWDGRAHRLGSLPGYPYSEARGVNDSGQVVGTAATGFRDRFQARVARAFLWASGAMTDLGTLGGPYSTAADINNAGQVVGKADTETFGQTHAFLWADGAMTDLGTLGGLNSLALRINSRGQVVGCADIDGAGTRRAFVWQDGQMTDLGSLPGLPDSVACGLSDRGQIVGYAAPAPDSSDRTAVVWEHGQAAHLSSRLPLGSDWTLTEARAVNDRGQIAGIGLLHGHPHAFLLTPKPEQK